MESHAVVFPAPNQVEFRKVTCPDPGPEDVVIDIHHSWISNGTEGSFLRGERLEGDVAWKPGHPMPFPMVAGYQKVGRVKWVGSAVKNHAVGDWVFSAMSRICGMYENRYAGHVSPAVCVGEALMPLPPGVDPVAFSGLVLTQVGYNCATRSPVKPGQVAVVMGDGLVGQWAGQTFAQQGLKVAMVGRHPDRLAKFARHGATFLSGSDNGVAAVRAWAPGPVQVLVESVGSAKVMRDYLPLLAHDGHIAVAGFYQPAGDVNLQEALQSFRNSEISFDLVSGATRARLEETMRWIAAGKLDTLGLITHRLPVERAAEAWTLIETKREPVLGVVFDWPAARGKG